MKKIFFLLLFAGVVFSSSIDQKKFKVGKDLYEQTCISCHGVDGTAETGMSLVVKPRDLSLTLLDEEQTYQITKDGAHYWGAKADVMPAFKYVFGFMFFLEVTIFNRGAI